MLTNQSPAVLLGGEDEEVDVVEKADLDYSSDQGM
jgi:hypothetical protein